MYRVVMLAGLALATACGADDGELPPLDPDRAPRAAVDRFSDDAATLFRRADDPTLPGPDQPIDLDGGRFITRGLGPAGGAVRYYNLDVQPRSLVPVYRLRRVGETTPVPGQLAIFDYLPGDNGYSDLWRVIDVEVPTDYVANTSTDSASLVRRGFAITPTTAVVNCPIVPAGSTARRRLGGADAGLRQGWYRSQLVHYFSFDEAALTAVAPGAPIAPIYVAFAINPDRPGGGPPSGFRTEPASDQTHNVLGALPGAADYSPLWSVQVYDNAAFDQVRDRPTAEAAPRLAADAGLVNCPVVEGP